MPFGATLGPAPSARSRAVAAAALVREPDPNSLLASVGRGFGPCPVAPSFARSFAPRAFGGTLAGLVAPCGFGGGMLADFSGGTRGGIGGGALEPFTNGRLGPPGLGGALEDTLLGAG